MIDNQSSKPAARQVGKPPHYAMCAWCCVQGDELRAENERLQASELASEAARANRRYDELWRSIEPLKAENERLRTAIEALRGQMPHWVANTLKAVEQKALGSDKDG